MTASHLSDIEQALGITPTIAATESPFNTGLWCCGCCGNTTLFTGIASHSYGGPDCCQGGPDADECPKNPGGSWCDCITELTQDFVVHPLKEGGFDFDYAAWTGGGYDGEIGEYNIILCSDCKHVVYEDPKSDG